MLICKVEDKSIEPEEKETPVLHPFNCYSKSLSQYQLLTSLGHKGNHLAQLLLCRFLTSDCFLCRLLASLKIFRIAKEIPSSSSLCKVDANSRDPALVIFLKTHTHTPEVIQIVLPAPSSNPPWRFGIKRWATCTIPFPDPHKIPLLSTVF